MPEVRREDFRHRGRLYLREIAGGRQAVQIQDQQEILEQPIEPAQARKILPDRQKRFAQPVHLQGRQAVSRVSRDGREGQGHV